MTNNNNANKVIFDNLRASDRGILIREGQLYDGLNEKAKQIVADYNLKVNSGEYKFEEVSCICGFRDHKKLFTFDRYGFYHWVVLCERCGLVYANPRPTEEVLRRFYESGDYRTVYGDYDSENRAYEEHLRNSRYLFMDVFEALKGRSARTVFEFGCGGGWNLEYFKQCGLHVSGCDLDPQMLEIGKRHGIPNLEVGSFEVLQDKKFNVIILNHIVEHFFDFWSNMALIGRALTPGGILYVAAPNMSSYGAGRMQNAHNYYFRISNLRCFMQSLGFRCLNYGYMFEFQDFFCIFEKDYSLVTADVLHNEKEKLKLLINEINNKG